MENKLFKFVLKEGDGRKVFEATSFCPKGDLHHLGAIRAVRQVRVHAASVQGMQLMYSENCKLTDKGFFDLVF